KLVLTLVLVLAAVGSRGPRASTLALLFHQLFEPRVVDREPLLLEQLPGEVVWEPVRVVKLERVLRRHPRRALGLRAVDHLAQEPGALLEGTAEALLLGGEPLVDHLALG